MSETQTPRVFQWPDLSAYGIHLRLFTRAREGRGPTKMFAVTGAITPEIDYALSLIGFVRLPWGTYVLRDVGDPATFRQRFHNNIAYTFPVARTLREGDVCADGEIMRQRDMLRDVGDLNVTRVFGDPFRGVEPQDAPRAIPRNTTMPRLSPQTPEAIANRVPLRPSVNRQPPRPTPQSAPAAPATSPAGGEVSVVRPAPVRNPRPVPAAGSAIDQETATVPEVQAAVAPPVVSPSTEVVAPAPIEDEPHPAPETSPQGEERAQDALTDRAAIDAAAHDGSVPDGPAAPPERAPVADLTDHEPYVDDHGELSVSGQALSQKYGRILRRIEAERQSQLLDLRSSHLTAADTFLEAWSLVRRPPPGSESVFVEVFAPDHIHTLGYADSRLMTTLFGRTRVTPDGLCLEVNRRGDSGVLAPSMSTRALRPPEGADLAAERRMRADLRLIQNDILPRLTAGEPVDLDGVWRARLGLAPNAALPAPDVARYRDYLMILLGRSALLNETRHGAYTHLASAGRLMLTRDQEPRLLPHVAYAISRTLNYVEMPASWNGYISSDPAGMMTAYLPAHFPGKLSVGVPDAAQIEVLKTYLPLGADGISFVDAPIAASDLVEDGGVKIQVINLIGARAAAEAEIVVNGDDVVLRADLADLLDQMAVRDPDGRTVAILDASAAEAETLLREAARGWMVNGIAEIAPGAMEAPASARPLLVLSLGVKRPMALMPDEAQREIEITPVADNKDLWSWSSVTLARQAENLEVAASFGADGISRNHGESASNSFQEPYASLSAVGTPMTMTPKYQALSQRRSQTRVVKFVEDAGFADVDDFVAHYIGVAKDDLAAMLSPEQVDAIATAEMRMRQPAESGNSVLIGDNTGVGKTRENVALVKNRLMQDMPAVYFTEYGTSFGAIYQELGALQGLDLVRPLTLNNTPITDKITGEVYVEATPRHIIRGLTTRDLAPDCNVEMTCLILTPAASRRLRQSWEQALTDYRGDMPEDEAASYQVLRKLMTDCYQSGQITLLAGEALEDFAPFVTQDDIRAQFVERPDYNLVLASYSQINLPSTAAQVRAGRLSRVMVAEGHGTGGRKNPKFLRPAPKVDWMSNVVATMPNLLTVVDESHVAASDASNIGDNVDVFIERSRSLVYSSATWLKGVNGMRVYRRIFPREMPYQMVQALMTKGNETVHETITRMMVETGAYLRRELDMSKCTYNQVTGDAYLDRNIDMVNKTSRVLSAIHILKGSISARVSVLNDMIENDRAVQRAFSGNEGRATSGMAFEAENVASPLSRLEHTINIAMLADIVADRAVLHLQEGRKPLVAIDGTNEGYMRRFFAKHNRIPTLRDLMADIVRRLIKVQHRGESVNIIKTSESLDLADNMVKTLMARLPACLTETPPQEREEFEAQHAAVMALLREKNVADVQSFLRQEVRQIMREMMANRSTRDPDPHVYLQALSVVEGAPLNGVVGSLDLMIATIHGIPDRMPENQGAQVRLIMEMIEEVPDLPISALDHIRDKIEQAGYTCGEITGRQTLVRDGKIVPREIRDKGTIRDAYNNGTLDGLLINKSGSSSQDMHAAWNVADQRQRVTLFCGTQPEANTFAQLAGRTMRNGQTSFPWYETFDTGMPVTKRYTNNMYAKLRAMYALSTSNRDNALVDGKAIDMANPVGDRVCATYLSERPEITVRLGLKYEVAAAPANARRGANPPAPTISAARVLRCVDTLLPYHEQAGILRALESEYLAMIDELDAAGENPLKPDELRGESQIVSRVLVRGGAGVESDSVFSQPVYKAQVRTIKQVTPMAIETIVAGIESVRQRMDETPSQRADWLWAIRDDILMTWKGLDQSIHVDAYINGTAPHVCPMGLRSGYERLAALCQALRTIEIGGILTQAATGALNQLVGDWVVQPVAGASSRMVVNLIMPPRDSLEAVNALHYDVISVRPGDEKFQKDRLSILIRQIERVNMALPGTAGPTSVTERESGLNGADPDAFMRDWKEKSAERARRQASRGESHDILIGNELMAMSMVIEGKFGHPVVFHTDTGQMRGIIITHRDRYDAYNSVLESQDVAMAVLNSDECGKIEFSSKPPTLLARSRNGNVRVSLPHPNAHADFYLDNPDMMAFVTAHYNDLEGLAAANSLSRATAKVVVLVTDPIVVADLVSTLFRLPGIECRHPTGMSEAASRVRNAMQGPVIDGEAVEITPDRALDDIAGPTDDDGEAPPHRPAPAPAM